MIDIFSFLFPVILFLTGAAMVVLRAGASRVFFDVVGSFQANRLIADVDAKMGVINSIMLDGLSGIGESIGLITDQMQQLVDSTVPLSQEVEEARLEFEKFAANIQNSEELRRNIIGIGQDFGFTASQAQEAGARMAQLSGVFGGAGAIQAATGAGIQFGMIGGLETQDAMQRLIQLHQQTGALFGDFTQQQFNMMSAEQQRNVVTAESAKLLDQLNTIENRSAATMGQLTHVMNQFAASADLAGDSIEFMAGASATLIEAGEEQGKAGRALRMMYARLGADTGNNSELLRKYGVETKDANGNLRSMQDILGELSVAMRGRTEAEKLAVAQAIAGNDHYVRAIKLMNNYGRAIQLTTYATQRLDSAQEESDKKLQDQVYQLKEVEARLHNAKAALGNQLTPAVIHYTKMQGDMNYALAQTMNNEMIGNLVQGGYVIANYMRSFSGLGEAILNIMSLNVSLKTQETIMRSLGGHEIVRASAYGGRTAAQKANLMMLDQELMKYDQIARLETATLTMMKSKNLVNKIGLSTNQSIVNANMTQAQIQAQINNAKTNTGILDQKAKKDLLMKKQITEIQLQEELNAKRQLQIQEATMTEHEKDQLYLNHQRLMELDKEIEKEKAKLNYKKLENEYVLGRFKAGSFRAIQDDKTLTQQQKINLALKNQLTQTGAVKHILTEQNKSLAIIEQKELERFNLLLAQNGLYHVEDKASKAKIQSLTAELALHDQILLAELQEVLAMNQAGMKAHGLVQAQEILNLANMEGTRILGSKMSFQQKQNLLEDLASKTAVKLGAAYGVEATAIRGIINQLPMFTNMTNALTQAQERQFAAQMKLNNTMMTMSGIMGLASMVAMMFSDNQDMMRVGMVLMMASMIPMTIQMGVMMKQTAGTAAGLLGFAGAANTAAVATTRLGKAVQFLTSGTVLGLLATAGIAAFAYFGDFGEDIEKTDDSMKDFSQTVMYTADQFNNMKQSVAGLDISDIRGQVATAEADVKDLEKDLAKATDDTNRKFIEKRLNLRKQELAVLKDIYAQESATMLLGETGEKTARAIFDAAQKYNEDVATAYKSVTLAEELEGRKFYETDMMGGTGKFELHRDLEEAVGGVFGQQDRVGRATSEFEKTKEDLMDALLKEIPEAYHQFVLDTAMASNSFEDFVATLEQFGLVDFTTDGFSGAIESDIIGPIEAAKEAMFEFNNEREEMFFGMAKGNITGDMVKQVVNKGVETLINTVEVIMTNTFNGMTTEQAATQIVGQIERQLKEKGINVGLSA